MRKLLAFLILLALLTTPLFAQKSNAKKNLQFTVISIKAIDNKEKKAAKKVDADILNTLKSLYKFPVYELINKQQLRLSDPGKSSAKLPGSLKLDLSASTKNSKVESKVKIKDKSNSELLNTTINIQPGKKVILGGWKFGNDTLIVVIKANVIGGSSVSQKKR